MLLMFNKIVNLLFGELVTFEGDILYSVLNCSTLLFRSRINRIVDVIVMLLAALENIVYLQYVRSAPSINDVIKYLAMQVIIVAGMAGYIYVITHFHLIFKLIETMKHCIKPISEGSEKTIRKIKDESKHFGKLIIIPLIAALAAFMPGFVSNEEMHYILMYISKRYGRGLLFRIIYYFCLAHLYILKEKIEGLTSDNDLFCDSVLQNEIYAKIKECVHHHLDLKRCHVILNRLAALGLMVGQGVAIVVITTIIIFTIWRIETLLDVKVITIFVMTNGFLWEYCYLAQMYENEFELLYLALTDLPWYNWNIRNRQSLHIFIMNTQYAPAIKYMGNKIANNQSITETYQAVYTLITFFCAMSSKT